MDLNASIAPARRGAWDLLLLCARTAPDCARIRAIATAGVDWWALIDLAARHGVRPLVFSSLRTACDDLLPGEIRDELQKTGRAITGRNLLLTGALLRIAAAFDDAALPMVAMKGPILGQMAYGDFALREFSDLDVLVREEDFARAAEALGGLGYQAGWQVESGLKVEFLRYQGESWYPSTNGGPTVDLHWRVAAKNTALRLEAGWFWPRFRRVAIGGREILTFTPQDLPLHLAAQGGQDQWSDFRRLCDLTELMKRHPELDWEAILGEARRLHGLRNLLVGMDMAVTLLQAPCPEPVRAAVRADAKVAKMAAEAIKKMKAEDAPGDLRRLLFQVRVQERLRDRVRLSFGLLTDRTDSDGQWLLLPKPMWGLYRVLRPIRMLGRML